MTDKKNDNISNYDMTIYNIKRENMFKGTILMCIIYAIFAFILIISAYVSDNIKTLLFERFLPFTLIYIIGTIIIILVFVAFIFSFKAEKLDNTNEYPIVSCPDYWKLEIVDEYDTKTSFDTKNYDNNLFKYKCVMDDKIFSKHDIFTSKKNDGENHLGFKLANIHGVTYKYDLYDNTKKIKLDKLNEDNYYKYTNIFKDITRVDYNTNTNTTPLKHIIDKDKYTSNILQSNLTDASFAMNSYVKDGNIYKSIHTNSNNLSHNIPPVIWSAQHTDQTSTVAYEHTDIASDNTSAIMDWNGYTYDEHLKLFGKQKANIYVSGTSVVKVGTIDVVDNASNLKYISETTIRNTIIPLTSAIDDTNGIYIYNGYIHAGVASAPTSANLKDGYNVKIVLYKKIGDINSSNIFNGATSSNIPLVCDRMYPAFLAHMDDKNDSKNKLRCAYSKICGVTWSDMNCK